MSLWLPGFSCIMTLKESKAFIDDICVEIYSCLFNVYLRQDFFLISLLWGACFLCSVLHTFNMQRSRFASTVSKCQGFCQGISPFYSICLSDKIAEAVKFLEIKKKSFPRTKKEFFCKRKKDFFHKKNFFTRHKLFMCIYIHYSYLHFVYF